MKIRQRILISLIAVCFSSVLLLADTIELRNGEVVNGQFVSADHSLVKIKVGTLVRTFRTDKVSSIKFSATDSSTGSASRRPVRTSPPAREVTPRPAAAPTTQTMATPQQRAEAQPAQASTQPEKRADPVTIPAGTFLAIRLIDTIDTDKNIGGDTFNASLDEAVEIGGKTVVPKNALVHGKIVHSKESGKISGTPELRLELTHMIVNGRQIPIRTGEYEQTGQGRGTRSAEMIGGGAAVGALIGAIAGKGKGVAIGAASGAAAGTAVQVLTKGNQLKIPSETRLTFRLQDMVVIHPEKGK